MAGLKFARLPLTSSPVKFLPVTAAQLLRSPSISSCTSSSTSGQIDLPKSPSMSGEDEVIKPVTVKIIETVYVDAGTADEFKSVVQRLTGKDSAAAEPEKVAADHHRSSRGDRKVGSWTNSKQSG